MKLKLNCIKWQQIRKKSWAMKWGLVREDGGSIRLFFQLIGFGSVWPLPVVVKKRKT